MEFKIWLLGLFLKLLMEELAPELKSLRNPPFNFDRQAWIQAISGHVFFFNSRIKINQKWGLWLIETEQLYSMPDISSIPPNSTVQD